MAHAMGADRAAHHTRTQDRNHSLAGRCACAVWTALNTWKTSAVVSVPSRAVAYAAHLAEAELIATAFEML